MNIIRKIVTVAVATFVAMIPAVTAEAATARKVTVCFSSSYAGYAVFPQAGGLSTSVLRNSCKTLNLAGVTYAKVYGYWNSNSGTFYAGTAHLALTGSVTVFVAGSTTSPNVMTASGTSFIDTRP
ncbi:hypothetical protein [Streptomyces sp. TLI_171]|uniref:hypothetical protein n=1 Tax=Streptomyces sp. TLI_171 TaxID=1938859 RepID=UPI000C174AEE|nr:hypothetical protein [Streptomyces sp. TLI_171]RKE22033.1 hypothetical protein BX266_5443 [Streptomyces sp. TLI_171]